MKQRKSLIQVCILVSFLILAGCKKETQTNLKFAFLTDIHVTPGSPNEQFMDSVVVEINQSDVELVIITGDITNTGSDAELTLVKKILDKLSKPYLIIPGNHETNWSESAGLKILEIWGNDRFISEWNNFVLVGFSTGPFMKMGDGHVKQEDLQWLKRELASRMTNDKKLLSFAHYPLADGLDNWFDVTTILKEYNCLAAFCGHGHNLGLHNFDSIPGIMGRSLVLRNPEKAGYNIVELRNDSLFVSEKILGESISAPSISISLGNANELKKLTLSPLPDYSINQLHPSIQKTFQWTDTASVFSGLCTVGDSMIIYGNSLGWLKAVNISKSQIQWETKFMGPIYSTPAICNNVAVFGAIDGVIYGVNIKTGKIIWQVVTGNPVLASPLIANNKVYIGGGSKTFYCINASTGELVWAFDDVEGLIQGKPALNNDQLVFGAWDRHLYNVSATTGKLNWKWNNGRSNVLFSPGNIVPVISNNRVYIVAPDRFMTAININTGKEVWRTNKHQVRESMGISPDGQEIFAKLMNDSIVSVSARDKNFKTNWVVDAAIGYDHNPCPLIVNNRWVIGATKNGLITAIERKTQSGAWMHKTGNSSVNNMVFDGDNHVWVSLMEGKIIRLTVKE